MQPVILSSKSSGTKAKRFAGFQRQLIVALCGVAFAALFPHPGSAQAITYNDFNTPAANSGQTSTSCTTNSAASGVLFCFNAIGAGLSYIQDSYPPSIDPNASTDEDAGSTNYALQFTADQGSQASSMWYSIPQNVANGFNVWYAVKITPDVSEANCCTADGIAFVIQNAGGGKTDSISGSSETGSGFTVLGGGGGSLGYGGIDNSVALEMDTFPDSWDPWDIAVGYNDDNHMALQSCGPGAANSPAHYASPNNTSEPTNCLVTLSGARAIASNPESSSTGSTVTLADGNPHQVVVIYNGPNDSPANYLYVYLDPTFVAGTHTPVAQSNPIFSGPFNIANSVNLNNGTAYVGFTAANGGNYEQHEIMGFTFTPHNSGSANVCPSGATTPAPCSTTFPVTFNFTGSTTIGSVQVVTQGATGLDFTQASGNTCTGSVTSCNVNVNFAPIAPGLRVGAVELFDNSSPGKLIATQLIYGIGEAPAVAFGPGTQTTVNTTPAYPLSVPNGVAVDAAGDVFISDSGNQRVVEVAANGTATTVGTGLNYPQGLAVDGAGNLYVADNNLNEVLEIFANCNPGSPYSCQQVLVPNATPVTGAPGTPNAELGVAVDGVGDIFFGNFSSNSGSGPGFVAEIPANGGVPTTVYSPTGTSPVGLAVDAAGDLFIADFGLAKVVEIPAGCTSSTCWIQVGTGWDRPEAVAVDAAGDVFVADEAPKVVEVPAGCINNSACQITISGTYAYGVAVDGKGNVYIPDRSGSVPYSNADNTNNQVIEINKSQPPSLSFATTYVGSTSEDSPQSLTIQDIGNQTLRAVSPGLVVTGPNFIQVSGSGTPADCTSTFSLTPGADCNVSISFTPQSQGLLGSSAVFTDNALNSSSTSQSVSLSGEALNPVETLTLTGSGTGSGSVTASPTGINCSIIAGVASGPTCSSGYVGGTGVSMEEVPSTGSTFTGWGGACASAGTSQFCNLNTYVNAPTNVSASFAISSVTVPNVFGLTQSAATTALAPSLVLGTVTTQYSDSVPSGSVISESPVAGTSVLYGSSVNLIVSEGTPPSTDQLTLENNYFVTGDYASGGVALRGTGNSAGIATGIITIPDSSTSLPGTQGVPDGADIIDGFLYWTTLEDPSQPAVNTGTFLGYTITGQQIGSDVNNYSDGTYTGTLRVYRADVNSYFQVPAGWNGARQGSGQFIVTLPDSGGNGLPITEGASLVVIWRVLSPNFPLKSVVIYDGSIVPASLSVGPIPQAVQGFYDSAVLPNVTGENTILFASQTSNASQAWNISLPSSVVLPVHSSQYIETLNTGNAYAAVILSTPVNNSDNDGILDAWKTGPPAGDPNYGNPGYYDVKTGSWVTLPGATHGEQDLFVQFDYMPNLYPSPDAQGNDPLAMVTQAYANIGVHLHLVPGNAIPETTCTDNTGTNPPQLCMFPNEPGVVTWDGSVQLSKVLPANYSACTLNPKPVTCAPRFPYGQKDSYHYVLFGYSVAIPSWTTRSGSILSITVSGGSGSIVTTGLGTTCPTRITVTGVQGNSNLNGIYDKVYNNLTCDGATLSFSTPVGVPNWSYSSTVSNGLAEPAISVTSGTVTTMSGFSDLGGSDSVVSLGAWATSTAQDMSKSATVVAGTLFHEIGHTLGLTHGGLYFDKPNSYIPTFEANCKPNFQSSMNYLFQIDGVGSNAAIAYSNQALEGLVPGTLPEILGGDGGTTNPNFATIPFGSVVKLTDASGNFATYPTSSWYTPTAPSTTTSPATMHCDGTPLNSDTDTAYRVTGQVDPVSPAWLTGQNITFDGAQYSDLRGYNDVTGFDLRQVGAASGELAALANEISYRSTGVFYGGSGGLSIGGSGGLSIGGSGGLSIGGSGGLSIGGSGGLSIGGSGGLSIGGSGGLSIGGSGGLSIGGSGGVPTEVDYLTANSVVRPPSSPGYTPSPTNVTPAYVTINWSAPAFGVVQAYTIYRQSTYGTTVDSPVVIGSVTGDPPATTFVDTNPDTVATTVVYTIATTLLPVTIDPTSRSSAPSVPAVLKYNQTIVLNPLSAPPVVGTPVSVSATSQTNGAANSQSVSFSATSPTGSCSIESRSGSTANLTLASVGSCTITASQAGSSNYNPADPVSETFQVVNSAGNAQQIVWAPLSNVQYGSTFLLTATSTAGLPVSYATSGPCTNSGATTGIGLCTVTATAQGSSTYGTASAVQSFTISPAIITVTANSPTIAFGQTPVLTFTLTGPSSFASGMPALSTTANASSAPGTYPITIAAGTMMAPTDYSLVFVPGTLTITTGPFITVSPSSINFGPVNLDSITTKTVTVSNTGSAAATISTPFISLLKAGNLDEFVMISLCPSSLAAGKSCTITISFVAGAYYNTPQTATLEVMDNSPGSPQGVMLSATVLEPQTITFTTNPPPSAAYKMSFTVAASAYSGSPATANGNPVTFTSSGACSNSGATYTMTSGTGTCSVIANQAGITNSYSAAPQVTKSVTATLATQTITFTTNAPSSAAYKTSFTVAATGGGSGNAVTLTSYGSCTGSGNNSATYTMTSGTGTCSVIANQAGNSNYSAAPKVTETVTATYSTASLSQSTMSFGTVTSGHSATQTATLKNTGTTPLIISSIAITGSSTFTQTNTCPSSSSSLAAGSSCTITVTFKPTSTTIVSGSLVVTDNTSAGTQAVSLSGN